MKRLHSLDSLKFVCAIMVVFIHYEILYTPFLNSFDRCAVPIFYMISGFFLGEARNINGNRIFRIIKRVTAMLFVACLLYTVQIIHSKANIFSYINRSSLLNCVIWGTNPLSMHLWYLHCYVYGILIIFLLKKVGVLNYILPFIPFLLVFNLLLGNYCIFFEPSKWQDCIYSRNWLLCTLPFLSIGMLVRSYQDEIKKYIKKNKKAFNWVIPLLFIFSICESYLLGNGILIELSLFNIITSIAVFCYFITIESKGNTISYLGLHYSMPIYVIHPFIGYILNILTLKFVDFDLLSTPTCVLFMLPLIVLFLTISTLYLYCIAVSKISKLNI